MKKRMDSSVARVSLAAILFICLLVWTIPSYSLAEEQQECTAENDDNCLVTTEEGAFKEAPDVIQAPWRKLVICSHNRLFVHYIDSGEHSTLHVGHGIYYSVVSHDSNTMWVSTRGSSDIRDDILLKIDLSSPFRQIQEKVVLEHSHFTHETIRVGNRLFAADTSKGAINIHPYPPESRVIRRIHKFGRRHHVNSLAPVGNDAKQLWAMFHNQSDASFAALFDIETGEVIQQVYNIGSQGHSWMEYPAHSNQRLFLSSGEASLVLYNLDTKERTILYKSPRHVYPKRMFLKGLAVLDDVAYFGESEFQDRAGRASVSCSLIAINLKTRKVLFERPMPGSIGLINTIYIPTRTFSSTYRAVRSDDVLDLKLETSCMGTNRTRDVIQAHRKLSEDARSSGFAYGSFPDDVDIVRLPFNFDVKPLQREVENLVKNHGGWVSRPDVNNYFVLLITKDGIVDDQSNTGPFAPVGKRLEESPAIREVIRSLGLVAGRSRLMMLKPGESVKSHFDRTNHYRIKNPHDGRMTPDVNAGYWGRRFRVHIPIFTDPRVTFKVGDSELHFKEGGTYVFDNAKMHSVENQWNGNRVHLVVDTVGGPRMLESILRDSRTEFFPSRPNRFLASSPLPLHPALVPTLPSLPSSSVLIETWTDAPVFAPMAVETVQTYLMDQVLNGFVRSEDKELVKGIFDSFLRVWRATPSELLNIQHELLDPVMCVEGQLVNGQSLYEAVEPLARMLFYKCYDSESASVDKSIGPPCTRKRSRS